MTATESVQHQPGSLGWTKALVLELTGSAVALLSAPGGPGRQSLRAKLDDGRSVIVTRRETEIRAETEAALLQVLSSEGAPVPSVLGYRDGLMVQEDMGDDRLSLAMVKADPAKRLVLARTALAALGDCRAAMTRRPDVLERLPGLGTRAGWADDFVSQAFFLSGDLGIEMPRVDAEALAASLAHAPEVFTRWDARLANAAVQPDGRVVWYDWDMFGRRAGVEDLGWAIADEYWGLSTPDTLTLLQECVPDPAGRTMALRVAVLVAANRLKWVIARLNADGWADADLALQQDRIGAVPGVISDVAVRMADLAAQDPMIEGFGDWFHAADAVFKARAETDQRIAL